MNAVERVGLFDVILEGQYEGRLNQDAADAMAGLAARVLDTLESLRDATEELNDAFPLAPGGQGRGDRPAPPTPQLTCMKCRQDVAVS
jgi:hypothetical protein